MNPAQLLKTAQAQGVTVWIAEGEVFCKVPAGTPLDLLEDLREHKPDLIAYLSSVSIPLSAPNEPTPQAEEFLQNNDRITTEKTAEKNEPPDRLTWLDQNATPDQWELIEPPAQMSIAELYNFIHKLQQDRQDGHGPPARLKHYRQWFPALELCHVLLRQEGKR